MSPEYFLHQLYPLQDKVLAVIATVPTSFYITDGTAVSRHYLYHRFSDDLDLFVNRSAEFGEQAKMLLAAVGKAFPALEINLESEDFFRAFVNDGDTRLKIELINDVGFRVDEPVITPLFVRTDSWQNILANKVTALSRNAAKDVSDIILMARNFPFQWRDVIANALKKDAFANELDVSEHLYDFPVESLAEVNWISPPDYECLAKDLKRIALDIFEGGANSLCK